MTDSHKVTIEELEELIVEEEYINPSIQPHRTICILKVRNGFDFLGTSCPVDPADFKADKGNEMAREDAIRGMWQVIGYDHKQLMHSLEIYDQIAKDIDP